MKIQPQTALRKKFATSLLGITIASVFIGMPPIAAQNSSGVLNPSPSIFNEPPYNRSGSTPSTEGTSSDNSSMTTSNTIVDVAASNGSFKTLTAALQAAGLDKVLQGKGPFTVFAPTDEAFSALPPAALQQLLKPENKALLIKILTYHVVSGKVTSRQLKSGQVTSVEGSPLLVRVSNGAVLVNNAKVIKADIPASNGVIHVIDQVMLPRDLQGGRSR